MAASPCSFAARLILKRLRDLEVLRIEHPLAWPGLGSQQRLSPGKILEEHSGACEEMGCWVWKHKQKCGQTKPQTNSPLGSPSLGQSPNPLLP